MTSIYSRNSTHPHASIHQAQKLALYYHGIIKLAKTNTPPQWKIRNAYYSASGYAPLNRHIRHIKKIYQNYSPFLPIILTKTTMHSPRAEKQHKCCQISPESNP